ncbi:FAD-binding oxidoreductase [Desulfospira joergensenii]|uniref:FAD-binding oxidoreductase n=1 Tax=Desulfospira joergensenii TaxID=53329 RepID=UPI0003B5D833|nr:FAD-linked oxidase C-terminal domain-containing protein [Desulfospira joergensenii]
MGFTGNTVKELEAIVGKAGVTLDSEELLCYSYDATGRSYLPQAVVFPSTEAQAADILKLAFANSIPVVPRGSGSGMTGGAVPVQGGIVLVTSQMNRILEIDRENFIARVQPGVIVGDLHRAVEEKGLFYPPDPASSSVCTIGGNVGECAGGPRAVKYGVTRDYILGLRAVLPSGEIIRTGVATAKGVAGYDLTRLIVGSEGTLALVTEITLRLLAKPEQVKTMAAFFDSVDQAARTVSGIMKQAIVPRCVEYLDEASIRLVRDSLSFEMPDSVKALLILELDGDSDTIEREAVQVRDFCEGHGSLDVILAENQAQADQLWQARKALSPILFKIAKNKINEDIVVPISRIPDLVRETRKIQEKSGLTLVSFGHAGDGNIHCNIMYDQRDKDQAERAEKAVDDLFEVTLNLGGTITGEHGVGITKMKFLPREISSIELNLMKGIKKVFDPENILNPGKIFIQ